jgi:voltage-gated potassium channel
MKRGTITKFIKRHHFLWEISMAILALIYLGTSFITDEGKTYLEVLLISLAIIFLTEFFIRLWDAPSRKVYLRQHWLDLISSIPLVGGLRSLRILRLLRLGAVLKIFNLAEHEAERYNLDRESLWYMGPILFILWISFSEAYYILEKGTNSSVHTFSDALQWSFLTIATLGVGEVHAVTAEGKILTGLLIFTGISSVGFMAAQVTGRFLKNEHTNQKRIIQKMNRLEKEVEGLHEKLDKLLGK